MAAAASGAKLTSAHPPLGGGSSRPRWQMWSRQRVLVLAQECFQQVQHASPGMVDLCDSIFWAPLAGRMVKYPFNKEKNVSVWHCHHTSFYKNDIFLDTIWSPDLLLGWTHMVPLDVPVFFYQNQCSDPSQQLTHQCIHGNHHKPATIQPNHQLSKWLLAPKASGWLVLVCCPHECTKINPSFQFVFCCCFSVPLYGLSCLCAGFVAILSKNVLVLYSEKEA